MSASSGPARRGTVIIMAKTPEPGRVKTRLCPPCTPEQAATLAAAALQDTFAAVGAVPDVRRVLVLSGPPGPWTPAGWEVVAQRGGGLDERLAAAFSDVSDGDEPTVLVGMDTPQVTARLLDAALRALSLPAAGAVLGRALDGGWWAIGLKRPEPEVFLGVPMSTSVTWREQRRRLRSLGLAVTDLPGLVDVDDIGTAQEVARLAPSTRFAAALRGLDLATEPALAGPA
jgi:rSAM/selenodomain-associated transferase 1